jgi:hypothetical protein
MLSDTEPESSMSNQDDAVRGLEQATAITKACAAAGIRDPLEIPALFAFARSAEEFNTALIAHERTVREYNQFVATHGHDDPGQDYYVAQVSSAREVYDMARRAHAISLQTWRAARGLADLKAAA